MARQVKNPPGCMLLFILLVGVIVFFNIFSAAVQNDYVVLVFATVAFGVFFIILLQVVIKASRQNRNRANRADGDAPLPSATAAEELKAKSVSAKKSVAGHIIGLVIIVVIFFNTIMQIVTRGINDGTVITFTVFVVFLAFWLRGLLATLAHNRRAAEAAEAANEDAAGPKAGGVDFMTNRRRAPRPGEELEPRGNQVKTTVKGDAAPPRVAVGTTAQTGPRISQSGTNDFEINGILWRWRKGFTRPYIEGAFCSKCGHALNHVSNAENWQADFKCPRCGKTYVSITKQEPDAKPRSLAKTKHIISATIKERLR